MLHGLGADEYDLFGLAEQLDERLFIVSVRAPFPLAWGGYTWYDFREAGTPEPAMFRESCDKLGRFIDDALAGYPIDPRQLFLLGFSMGTVMALAMSLSRPGMFRGVVAMSGYLAEKTHLTYRWRELGALEFFIAHGVQDPLIPVQASRRLHVMLENAGVIPVYKEYAMQHQISEESLADVARWLKNKIGTDPSRDHTAASV
jgi:phospholipase/carboxylesterase